MQRVLLGARIMDHICAGENREYVPFSVSEEARWALEGAVGRVGKKSTQLEKSVI